MNVGAIGFLGVGNLEFIKSMNTFLEIHATCLTVTIRNDGEEFRSVLCGSGSKAIQTDGYQVGVILQAEVLPAALINLTENIHILGILTTGIQLLKNEEVIPVLLLFIPTKGHTSAVISDRNASVLMIPNFDFITETSQLFIGGVADNLHNSMLGSVDTLRTQQGFGSQTQAVSTLQLGYAVITISVHLNTTSIIRIIYFNYQ